MQSTFITYYLEVNLICFLFIGFVLNAYIHESRGLSEAKWFVLTLLTVMLYCVADILAALFKNKLFYGARAILWASNTIYISIPLILVILWNRFIREHVSVFYDEGKVFKYIDKIITVVSIVICAISLSTPITHATFYLDEMNVYHRKIGAYIVPAYAYLFMIYVTIKLQIIKNRSESLQARHDANILSMFSVPCVIFSMVQVFLYGVTITQVGFTMGIMYVFMERQRNKISRDELTGLNNRREYNYTIDRLSKSSGYAMIAMIDVDNFKFINDTYGHQEGDNALKEVAVILKSVCADRKRIGNVSLYRYGGDEFILVSTESNNEDVERILTEAIARETELWNKKSSKPYNISLSVGAGIGNYTGKEIYKLISTADKEMYKSKEKKKKEKYARVGQFAS